MPFPRSSFTSAAMIFSKINCLTEVVAYKDSLVSKFLLDAQNLVQLGLEDISMDGGVR